MNCCGPSVAAWVAAIVPWSGMLRSWAMTVAETTWIVPPAPRKTASLTTGCFAEESTARPPAMATFEKDSTSHSRLISPVRGCVIGYSSLRFPGSLVGVVGSRRERQAEELRGVLPARARRLDVAAHEEPVVDGDHDDPLELRVEQIGRRLPGDGLDRVVYVVDVEADLGELRDHRRVEQRDDGEHDPVLGVRDGEARDPRRGEVARRRRGAEDVRPARGGEGADPVVDGRGERRVVDGVVGEYGRGADELHPDLVAAGEQPREVRVRSDRALGERGDGHQRVGVVHQELVEVALERGQGGDPGEVALEDRGLGRGQVDAVDRRAAGDDLGVGSGRRGRGNQIRGGFGCHQPGMGTRPLKCRSPSGASGKMGKTEMLRFDVDANTSGLWEQVKGDIHTRAGKMGNAGYLRIVSRVYLDLVRQDKGA